VRVGIDLIQAFPQIGGGWHYAESLLRALAEDAGADEYIVFGNGVSSAIVPRSPRFHVVEFPLRPGFRSMKVLYESLIVGAVASRWRLDCMYHLFGALPLITSIPTVVTIYDLMVFARPRDFKPLRRSYVQAMRRYAAKSATMIAPMSQSTAIDLRQRFGVSPERLQVVPPAIGTEFHPRGADEKLAFRRRYDLPERFWLYVASDAPHKNHERLFAAYDRLRRLRPDAWPLVVRGATAAGLDRLVGNGDWRSVARLLPRLPDDEMPVLYSAASGLVFPSLFEGGGLPVMEAMCCGCPVAAADIPTTHEFAGPAAITFDPGNEAAITEAMMMLQSDEALRCELRLSGFERSGGLRPAATVAAMKSAYRRAVEAGASV
jgi:glycosyltransferase involved in cell wall biosynthesis